MRESAGWIFISYRHEETRHIVGRLTDSLVARFGTEGVFHDIGTIEPGVDFVKAIEEAIASCRVLLAVIGPRWLTITDTNGRRRLEDPLDFVRLEIEGAIRHDIHLIPVLIDDTAMPKMEDLPESLAVLTRRQVLRITESRFRYDSGRLITAIERASNVPHELLHQANEQMSQGRDQDALETIDRAVTISPAYADALALRGEILMSHKRYDQALESLDRALKLNPSQAYAARARGRLFILRKQYHAALEDLNHSLALYPNDAVALAARGHVFMMWNRYEEAFQDFNRAIQLSPLDPQAYYNRGRGYLRLEKYKEARADFETALRLDPNNETIRGLIEVSSWWGTTRLGLAHFAGNVARWLRGNIPSE
jgi:tetratricopeptide (TPR) repeat protein